MLEDFFVCLLQTAIKSLTCCFFWCLTDNVNTVLLKVPFFCLLPLWSAEVKSWRAEKMVFIYFCLGYWIIPETVPAVWNCFSFHLNPTFWLLRGLKVMKHLLIKFCFSWDYMLNTSGFCFITPNWQNSEGLSGWMDTSQFGSYPGCGACGYNM